jgi:hypothetical protein
MTDVVPIDNTDDSADDALEETRGEATVPIPQNDDDNPAGPASDPPQVVVPEDHPSTDTDVDETESYQEGSGSAAAGPTDDR